MDASLSMMCDDLFALVRDWLEIDCEYFFFYGLMSVSLLSCSSFSYLIWR